MVVGLLCVETIALARAYKRDHEWVSLNATEDQCCHCAVIATEEGKRRLARIREAERSRSGGGAR